MFAIEFVAKLKDELTTKLKGMTGAVKQFGDTVKANMVDGVRSALPDQLGFIADKLEALPVAATAAVGGLALVGKAAIDMATQVAGTAIEFDKLSQKTGASVEFLSTFAAVANDAEVSTDQVNTSLTIFSKKLTDMYGPFANVQTSLMELSDQFASMPDGPQKTALAIDAFGRSGTAMIPILNQGSAALRENQAAMAEMGRIISTDTVAAANKFDDAMDKLNGRIEGLKTSVGSGLLPALAEVVGGADSAVTSLSLMGHAFDELTSKGQVSAMTMLQINKAALDVSIAMTYLNPTLASSRTAFELQRTATEKAIEGIKGYGNAASGVTAASSGVAAGASIMGRSMVAASADAIRAAENTRVAMAMLASAQGAVAIKTAEAIAGTRRVLDSAYSSQLKAYELQQKVTLQGQNDIEGIRARQLEERNMTSTIDAANASLDAQSDALVKVGGAAGGAKEKTAELNDEMKKLEERQSAIGGFLGSNTEAMNAQQKVQTAYAIATGQLSQEQFAQEEAIKAVMQGLQDKKITEEQAVTTAMSLAQGYVSANDAMQVAGDSSKRFYDETAGVLAIAQSAKGKVEEMGLALKTLPKEQNIDVVATILGMDDLKRANEIVEKLDQHERHTIQYDVVYTVRSYGSAPPGAPPPGTDPSAASGASGGSQQGAGGKAMGGGVYGGQTVRVGELGPELFTPTGNGVITPNHQSRSGDNIVINVYTNDPEAAARAVAKKLKRG